MIVLFQITGNINTE